jgi:opacity protein-like surface antigen
MTASTRMIKPLCVVPLLLTFLGSAGAQTYEVSIFRGWARMSKAPLGSNNPDSPVDNETTFRNGSSTGIRLTLNMRGYYGHELGFTHTRAGIRTSILQADGTTMTPVESHVNIEQAYYNFLMYMMPKGERWRPFVTGGVQAADTRGPKIEGWRGVKTRNYGFNYGGGIKFKLQKHLFVRLDLRDYFTGKPYNGLAFKDTTQANKLIRQQEASFGLDFGF